MLHIVTCKSYPEIILWKCGELLLFQERLWTLSKRISAAVCQDESLSILMPVRSCLPIGGWDLSLWYHDVDRLIVALNWSILIRLKIEVISSRKNWNGYSVCGVQFSLRFRSKTRYFWFRFSQKKPNIAHNHNGPWTRYVYNPRSTPMVIKRQKQNSNPKEL